MTNFVAAQYEFSQINSKINSTQKEIARHKGTDSPERQELLRVKAELQQQRKEQEAVAASKKNGNTLKLATAI
jgi:hypothetical protein